MFLAIVKHAHNDINLQFVKKLKFYNSLNKLKRAIRTSNTDSLRKIETEIKTKVENK